MVKVGHQVISIFAGQGGIGLGNSTYELLCLEHQLLPNGKLAAAQLEKNFTSFFCETPSGQYVPRSLFVDLEPTCIDEIKTGTYQNLYHPDQLLNGIDDAASNYARGLYTCGKKMYEQAMNQLRKIADQCDNLGAIVLHSALGGGTGAGFGTGLLERLSTEFNRKVKVQIAIAPSPQISTSTVEPYNTILAMHGSNELLDLAMMFDNEALYNMSVNQLGIHHPTYIHLNRMTGQVLSCLTSSERFSGSLTNELSCLQTNLVPFPRLHYAFASFAPVCGVDKVAHQSLTTTEMTINVFDSNHQLVKCDLNDGKYMSCSVIFRGSINASEVNNSITFVRKSRNINFVDWCPTGFKIGITNAPIVTVAGSGIAATNRHVAMFCNHSSLSHSFKLHTSKFDMLYARKAFVFWYVSEGMEESELTDARESIGRTAQDYLEAAEDGSGHTEAPPTIQFAQPINAPPTLLMHEYEMDPSLANATPHTTVHRTNKDAKSGKSKKSADQRSKRSKRSARSKRSKRSKQ